MEPKTRTHFFQELFPDEPPFRYRQVVHALLDPAVSSWHEMTTLSKNIRETLLREIPWMSLREVIVLESRKKDTKKAVLECADGARIETVLMKNARGHWSVCVSSQAGCAMGCAFCATGSMGLTRNLTTDEIVDQFRFWQSVLSGDMSLESKLISNVVFMGMGEPLANYESVREAIRTFLDNTSLGMTRITVSTVGLLPAMKRLLNDPLWPSVRLAVSLHSADPETRRRLMPSSFDSFLDDLVAWTKAYFELHDERRQHLTFEYILLRDVNDRKDDVEKLITFSRKVGKVKVNLIPYNRTVSNHRESEEKNAKKFLEQLKQAGITATIRKAMGEDISAACGQLVSEPLFET